MDFDAHIFESESFAELIEDAITFFVSTPLINLPPDKFSGSGVYALYFLGESEIYNKVLPRSQADDKPIYVGKAVPAGWRQGRQSKTVSRSNALITRLKEHSRSISVVGNLDLKDFQCRFMILRDRESDIISTVEAALIRTYNPLWNSFIDGFGNHDPGKGRYEQAKSEWDILHPGRIWANRLRGQSASLESVLSKIEGYNDS